MRGENRKLQAADGATLEATFDQPVGSRRGAVLLASAMGVPKSYYAPIAAFLAREGFAVLTFDSRGIGASRPRSLRGFRADVLDWARLDAARALAELESAAPGAPITWLGHSLGGQIFPFVPGHERVAKLVTVATGSGYWRENAPRLKRYVWALWFVAVPLTMPLFGYFPGRRLGMVGDLPRGVMAQWRRWCLHPEYAPGAEPGARELYAAVRTPIASISFTDDDYMSERNVDSIHSFYSGAPRKKIRLAPADAGERAIGHFGFFRPRFEATLWRPVLLPELAGEGGPPVTA